MRSVIFFQLRTALW